MKKAFPWASLVAAVIGLLDLAAVAQSPPTLTVPTLQSRLNQTDRNVSLSFEPNVGQMDPTVMFLSRARGYSVFLTSDGATLALAQHKPQRGARPAVSDAALSTGSDTPFYRVLRMQLLGTDSHAKVRGVDELPGKINYFRGKDPRNWRAGVIQYSTVRYEDVYPGVDMIYSGDQGQLEYSFLIAPGANPHAISISLSARQVSVDRSSGDLVIKLGDKEVRFHKPVAYQLAGSEPRREAHPVNVNYVLDSRRRVTFRLGSYDPHQTLIIDPVLNYSSYVGGSNFDYFTSIAVDSSGSAYLAGYTNSADFPTTSGTLQTTCAGSCTTYDAFVTKLDPTGSTLIYSTYLGGSSNEYGNGITVDSAGDAYIVGQTFSSDFPATPGAFQTSCGGICSGGDAFVAELDPTGSTLLYSTYLGGSGADQGNGIVLDSSNNAYVTGYTMSTSFPVTAGAFQTTCTCSRSSDAFVSELNSTGSALIFSTYMGGNGADLGYAIALDVSNNPYVTGYTSSTNFPTSPGAFQTTLGANRAAFVAALSSTGSALLYSTYLGGTSTLTTPCEACATSIAVDSLGDAYVSGLTAETNFPVTPGAFQTALKSSTNGHNAFITELNPTGTGLVFSTYLGGAGDTGSTGIAIDPSGNVWLKGNTKASNFPVTPGSFQTTFAGNFDAWVAELNPTGTGLLYSTYLGGSGDEFGGATHPLAIDSQNPPNVYVTGYTDSSNFPASSGAFQTALAGSDDGFVAWFAPSPNVGLSSSSVNFGSQIVGTTSSAQTVTLTNTGNLQLDAPTLLLTGPNSSDYAETDSCSGNVLAPQASCTISLTFTPTLFATETATLTITDNAPGNPQNISLTGIGSTAQAGVTLSSTSLTFPATLLGSSSAPLSVTLTNSGTIALTISALTVSGDFGQTNTCGGSVNPGTNCLITVTFIPTAINTRTGTVTITDNAANSPQTISLAGIGTEVQLSASSLSFGTVSLGTSSSPQTVTVTNIGSTSFGIKSITLGGRNPGDYSETSSCGSSLAAGAACTVNVTFTPQVKGSLPANVSIRDAGGGSPQIVTLSGTGQ